ncbi:Germin-like protein subfamily 1 member 20 [Morella rubra]|uniref:Germin-like protein n=1 Tax=Morella rubra TaxID=262757 RepID=A0A6A1V5H6_9ROSI|nr:Germin-like protein subfamily 1 member 20 [Morella rubra]
MMRSAPKYLVPVALLALACTLVSAYDPSPLQDFCVAINSSTSAASFYTVPSSFLHHMFPITGNIMEVFDSPISDGYKLFILPAVFVNGKFCKDPKVVTANDFFFPGLQIPETPANRLGSNVTLVNVDKLPGLNTLGISLARIDFAPYGLNPPHTHPRGTEIIVVAEGTLYVGFVTSNTDNKLFTKVLNKGDVFVFPIGLIHFQFNVGKTNAVAFAGLSSQNPGVITIANAVFGSNPPINPDVLTKAFQVDKNVVNYLQKQFY